MSKEKKAEKGLSGPFDATLNAIHAASQTLNRAADEASAEIEALEDQLAEIDPGVTVWTGVLYQEPKEYVGPGGRSNGTRSLRLGYVKGKKGGLIVSEEVIAFDGSIVAHEEVPLRKADRDVRLLLRPYLRDVLNQLLNALNLHVGRLPVPVSDPDVFNV